MSTLQLQSAQATASERPVQRLDPRVRINSLGGHCCHVRTFWRILLVSTQVTKSCMLQVTWYAGSVTTCGPATTRALDSNT